MTENEARIFYVAGYLRMNPFKYDQGVTFTQHQGLFSGV